MTTYRVLTEFDIEIPDGEERLALYGTTDPMECVRIDYESDGAMFIAEIAGDFKFLRIEDIDELS